jgi:hypothetical protein
MKKQLFYFSLFGLMIFSTGCIPGDGACTPDDPGGFFSGIWHGWIAPVSLIIGFFKDHIRIYEVHNTGWWYDFGYYVAIIGGFGGFALLRKSKSDS